MGIVYEGKGDMFKADVQTVVNTVNCEGVSGKGLALYVKMRWKESYLRYRHFCKTGQLKIGKLYLDRNTKPFWILHFPTKNKWRANSELEWIEEGLCKLVYNYEILGITSIAFPPLGCANGGLDYDTEVRPLMRKYLDQLSIPVHILGLEKDYVTE